MGVLDKLLRRTPLVPKKIPAGSFVISRSGRVLVSTFPQKVPQSVLVAVGGVVLRAFSKGEEMGMRLDHLEALYGAMRITARRLHSGALVFLLPQSPFEPKQKTHDTSVEYGKEED